MAFIESKSPKIGDWVITRKTHSCLAGTITKGSYVKIIGIDPMRGYDIEDKDGNWIIEIGWII